MRLARVFSRTSKEIPKDAQISSHRLMFRAGMIQQLSSGIYSYLPLALRSIRKIEKIIREELDARGYEEILMPAVIPANLWQETDRWNLYGDLLLRFKDRKGNDYCMGPTHEEVITDVVRRNLRSWKQLPICLYQIQGKFRDEFRPRFGLMRGREFIMKDAYSFDADEKSAKVSYQRMYEAYTAIFSRCGVRIRVVDANTGEIGGDLSHEFQVLASSGEDILLICDYCEYAANIEKAETHKPSVVVEDFKPLEAVATPGQKSIEEVSSFLGVPPKCFLKCLIYETDNRLIAVLIPGDRKVNEIKLRTAVEARELRLASNSIVEESVGTQPGYVGPLGLPDGIQLLADYSVQAGSNWVCGANSDDKHNLNVNFGRDFEVDNLADVTFAVAGDLCPKCRKGKLEEARGVEVGQVFYLGDKYSKLMKCTFLDKNGDLQPALMGCYGIGVGRTLAATVEQSHDEFGIIWPVSLAPWEVVILPLQLSNSFLLETAESMYKELGEAGIEVVLDDRNERAGFKFKDADLIGYPIQVILGPHSVSAGMAEIKFRASGERVEMVFNEVVDSVSAWILDRRHGDFVR
ncbi:Prolyl-tRNA synthetase, bacterial type [Olavius algarvensis spirochete endosymbiont]|uniref:proline--tRNA ligase n=1 Tax=Olavius algarvensis spirochete endosymbiont TaxID=260710 RepID=UPI00052D6281|nr:proline--tRNA ligase [Olavius algarvensis spirochete endosymbiont]KGM43201.1 prolyl-tRNA synthetase [Alkalispirochaeta odontotermitis]VDA99669.1 Prolyl-tRNA synthetase, bacterial type [Olavius algarvensis spirochete endosymbiont]